MPRLGKNLYQTASYVLEGYTLDTVRTFMMSNHEDYEVEGGTPTSVTWSVPTVRGMRGLLGNRMAALKVLTSGISRGQMAPSESYIRVVGTILPPLELNWWQSTSGRGRLQINFMHALVMGEGDIQLPKDSNLREILLSPTQIADCQVAALQDVRAMADLCYPLSPAWWRQLGQEDQALQAEARIHALMGTAPSNPRRGKRRALSQAIFPIERILQERAHSSGTPPIGIF